jgi:hypothetical protein
MANCQSISSLLNPLAVNLKPRDWVMIRVILRDNVEARGDVRRFRRVLEDRCQAPGNASAFRRICQSLLN